MIEDIDEKTGLAVSGGAWCFTLSEQYPWRDHGIIGGVYCIELIDEP
jgi:hypothetical protein